MFRADWKKPDEFFNRSFDMKNRLTDSQGRVINYLRLSVTDRCNLRCSYCIPSSQRNFIPHNEILSYEEIVKTLAVMAKNGLQKVRLTGGEPLVRKDIDLLVREIKKIQEIREVTITTNATLLSVHADRLKRSGIDRINISLDTLNPHTFEKITGKDELSFVLEGIQSAKEAGMTPVKINTVILNNINSSEIEELAALSIENDFHIRFIELMPIGSLNYYEKHKLSASFVKKTIENRFGELVRLNLSQLAGPAAMYKIRNSKGKIGFIHAMTSHFCAECNRIRLTADGHIRPCLLEDSFVDLKEILRKNADDKEILQRIKYALTQKASAHDLIPNVKTEMASIGG